MKTLFLLFMPLISFTQPDPSQFYPDRIMEITELLKTDSLNPELIWKRVQMEVSLEARKVRPIEYYNSMSTPVLIKNDTIFKDINFLIDGDFVFESDYRLCSKIDFIAVRSNYYNTLGMKEQALSDMFEVLRLDTLGWYEYSVLYSISEVYLVSSDYKSAMKYAEKLIYYHQNYDSPNSEGSCTPSISIDLKMMILRSWNKHYYVNQFYKRLIAENLFHARFDFAKFYLWDYMWYLIERKTERPSYIFWALKKSKLLRLHKR